MTSSTLDDTTHVASEKPTRPHRIGAVVVGAVDGALGIALPFAVYAVLALVAWAGLGRPEAWTPYLNSAADVWLLGHGVDLRFAASGHPFTVTIAVLGPMLVTTIASVRAGRRAAQTESPVAAWAALLIVTALGSTGLLIAGTSSAVSPVPWQGIALPVLTVAIASVVGLRRGRGGLRPLPDGIRAGLMATAMLLAAASIALTVALFARFADVVGLYESLAAGPAGGLALTCAQMLALPTVVVWAASWLLGAGVTLGIGSVTGPFVGQVGPLPALPLLGAVPTDPPTWAAAVLVVPVAIGFAAGVLARRSGATTPAVGLGVVAGVVAGVVLGVLALLASGAAGPGRFAAVGPDALVVAGLAAALIGVPAMVGAAVVRARIAPREAEEAAQ